MKTDRFNEAVRRKLEGIEPPFQEQEWSKFQAFYKQQTPATWWVRTGAKWVGYGATGLVATILVVTNIIQYRENRLLRQTVSELRKEIQVVRESAARASVAPGNAITVVPSPLTRPNEKTVPSEDARREVATGKATADRGANPGLSGSGNDRLADLDRSRASAATSGFSVGRKAGDRLLPAASLPETVGLSRENGSRETRMGDLSSGGTRSGGTRSGETRSVNARTAREGYPENTSERSSAAGENRLAGTDQNRTRRSDNNGLADPSYTEQQVSPVQQKFGSVAFLKPHTDFDVYPEGIPVKTSIPVKRRYWSAPVAEAPSIRLPKTHSTAFRVGGGFEWEKNYAAKSVSVGVLLGKHWGLNTGLTVAKVIGESYVSERKFIDKNHRDFRMNHAPKVPPNFKIININTETDMIRIPVSVTYRTNLPDNWAFLTTAGTMLDVHVNQQYKFNVIRNPFTGEFSNDKTLFRPKEQLINTVNAGVGLEKRFAHLAFQAEAYLAPSLQNNDYRLEKTPAGLRIRALYEF